jgi:hypothetical protein
MTKNKKEKITIKKDKLTVTKYRKAKIPKAIREQCWISVFGEKFKHKCYIPWCENTINVFDFHVGHDLPESKGGTLDVHNLKPICARCNLSMSDNYTIKEWINLTEEDKCPCLIQ